jgi:hypothetical protein
VKSRRYPRSCKATLRSEKKLGTFLNLFATVKTGRRLRRLSQKTCRFEAKPFTLSGEKQECNSVIAFIFQPFFREQSLKKFSKK